MFKNFEELNRTIRNLQSVTDLLKSMGEKTENVFDIEDNFRGSEQMKACVEKVKAIPKARTLVCWKWRIRSCPNLKKNKKKSDSGRTLKQKACLVDKEPHSLFF